VLALGDSAANGDDGATTPDGGAATPGGGAAPPGGSAAPGDGAAVPLLEGRLPVGGSPTVYVCREFTCRTPLTDPLELREALSYPAVTWAETDLGHLGLAGRPAPWNSRKS